jgi:hypothetical protein
VVEVVADELVLVSTTERFRVAVEGTDEVLADLVSYSQGARHARDFNERHPDKRAVLLPYLLNATPIVLRKPEPKAGRPIRQTNRRFLI